MLSYIWVSVRNAISSAGCFWISGTLAQRCGKLFRDDTLAANVTGSFITGLFAVLADFEGRRLVSPSLRQFFMTGVCGGSVTSEKARVIHYRANVERNG
jgi:fluoride ion exporter CrcB/FEX